VLIANLPVVGRIEIAELLIRTGADINVKNAVGWTPLMIAITKKDAEIVRLLLKSTSDLSNSYKCEKAIRTKARCRSSERGWV